MIRLKQSTASQEIPLGPFLDSSDGNTEETGLTIANTDIKLWKAGATTLASKNSGGATYISNGVYYCVLDATDTNTLGALVVFVHVAGALAVRVECEVLAANVYDSLIGGTDFLQVDAEQIDGSGDAAAKIEQGLVSHPDGYYLPVDVFMISADQTAADNLESYCDGTTPIPADATRISGDSGAADNLEATFDGTGYANAKAPATQEALQTVDDMVDDIGVAGAGLTAVPWNAAWDAEVQSEATDALNAYDPPTKAELDAAQANVSVDEIQASALADLFNTDSGTTYAAAVSGSPVKEIADNAGGSALTEAGIADAVWNEALADHNAEDSIGNVINDLVDEDGAYQFNANALELAPTGGSAPTVEQIADGVWDELITGHDGAGKAGAQLWTDVDAILVDTGTDGVALADGAITAAKVATNAIDADALAADAATEIADAVLAAVVEGTLTLQQVQRLALAALAGRSAGGGTTTVTFRDNANSKARITATVDASGNRTAVTLDGT